MAEDNDSGWAEGGEDGWAEWAWGGEDGWAAGGKDGWAAGGWAKGGWTPWSPGATYWVPSAGRAIFKKCILRCESVFFSARRFERATKMLVLEFCAKLCQILEDSFSAVSKKSKLLRDVIS